jgi:hypothetical protein
MTLKNKWDNHFDKSVLYSWIFINGIMKFANEETYKITLKENYVHRTPYYEIDITKREKKDENN